MFVTMTREELLELIRNDEEIQSAIKEAVDNENYRADAAEAAAIIPETTEDKGGFFSDDDGDDTIALSFDELDNIMNTAEISDAGEAAAWT